MDNQQNLPSTSGATPNQVLNDENEPTPPSNVNNDEPVASVSSNNAESSGEPAAAQNVIANNLAQDESNNAVQDEGNLVLFGDFAPYEFEYLAYPDLFEEINNMDLNNMDVNNINVNEIAGFIFEGENQEQPIERHNSKQKIYKEKKTRKEEESTSSEDKNVEQEECLTPVTNITCIESRNEELEKLENTTISVFQFCAKPEEKQENIQSNESDEISQMSTILPTIREETEEEVIDSELSPKVVKKPSTLPGEYPQCSYSRASGEGYAPRFIIRDSSSDTSTDESPKAQSPVPPDYGNHTIINTIDTILLILEGTLAGACRISHDYKGEDVHPIIRNTMKEVKASVEELKHHFSFSDSEKFEPSASVIQDLLTPVVRLFKEICPTMDYTALKNIPQRAGGMLDCVEGTQIFLNPQENTETCADVPELTSTPILLSNLSLVNNPLLVNVGATAMKEGFIRVKLAFDIQVDITLDSALCVRNLRDNTAVSISASGNTCGMVSPLAYVFRHGQVVDVNVNDEFTEKVLWAKINAKSIHFSASHMSQNLQLTEEGVYLSNCDLREMDEGFIKYIFSEKSMYGPDLYYTCCKVIEQSTSEDIKDHSYHFTIHGIKISQHINGHVIVSRNNNDFCIWAVPENISQEKTEKGFMRVATADCRMMTTVISDDKKHAEKIFLLNLDKQWIYYNTEKIVVSNGKLSAEY